jgi:hypothetical protein
MLLAAEQEAERKMASSSLATAAASTPAVAETATSVHPTSAPNDEALCAFQAEISALKYKLQVVRI